MSFFFTILSKQNKLFLPRGGRNTDRQNIIAPIACFCMSLGHLLNQNGLYRTRIVNTNYNKDGEKLHSIKQNRTVEKYEQYLKLYGLLLHPDNLCLVRIKYTLVGFYGRAPGYHVQDLIKNPKILDRKLQLTKEVLNVLKKSEPGISSSRGVILYEMHMPIFLKAQLNLNLGLIDVEQAKKEFQKSINCIEESMRHLKFNSQGSFGNQLFVGAHDTLRQLKSYMENPLIK